MKKHEPRPTSYAERSNFVLVAEYITAAILFAYPMHLISDALNCNISTRTGDNSKLTQIAKAGN